MDRIQADQNDTAENNPVDADIAIIDTGIDLDHPDLNVVASVNCARWFGGCADGGDDGHGHGSHVAGISAAIDNDEGVIGVAPGARLWAVRVLDDNGSGMLSWILNGIEWVTQHADEIEVANMSLGFQGTSEALIDAGVDNDLALELGSSTVAALPAGQSTELAFTWRPEEADIGHHTLIASHDWVDDNSANDSCSAAAAACLRWL